MAKKKQDTEDKGIGEQKPNVGMGNGEDPKDQRSTPEEQPEMTALEFGQMNGFTEVDKSAVRRKYKNTKKRATSWAREFKNKVNF